MKLGERNFANEEQAKRLLRYALTSMTTLKGNVGVAGIA